MNDIISLLIQRIGKSSVLEFSNRHGLKHQTIRQWISGQRQINIDGMRLLAKAFPDDRKLQQALRAYWIGLLEDAIATSPKRRKSGTVTAK
ncbi:MAG TPA: hypothetical protein PLC98_03685 [Anaerolineales bacterium]|nr:hypothetical protein [Anaerolineales bacterium]